MKELKVVYNGTKPIACGTSASGQVGTFRAVFSFSPDWDAYPARTAVFVSGGEPVQKVLDRDNACEVPEEITKNAGRILVGAYGNAKDASGRTLRYPGENTCVLIPEGASAHAVDPTPQEVTLYEKMLARLAQAETEAQEATENAKNAADKAKSAADRANEAAKRAEEIKPGGAVQSVNGKTGDVQLDASDVGALPKDTPIPAKTSDLQNDNGYITRLVSDLANYYRKSETYTQEEIRAMISAIPKFEISVVSALPTQNINETTVYLLKSGEESGDLYTEYIYAGGAWEILGSQRVDLTGYATEAWVNGKLADYITPETLTYAMITAALGYTPAKESDIPSVPVQSVNGKTGTVQLTAPDVGALPKDTPIPKKTSEITNDSGYITIAVATLLNYYLKTEVYAKAEAYSRTEIDNLIDGIDKRLSAVADSDDITLDQLSEIVTYIKANKSLIDSVTTSKVNVADIIDNLTTADSKKPLSAAQGKALKALYDAIPAWAKASTKPAYTKTDVGLGNLDNVKQYSESNPPPYPVQSVNGKTGDVQLGASDVGAASEEAEIHYIVGNSTTAGVWTGTCDKIDEYYDGLTILYKINVAGVSGGTTLNINGLGAIPVHRNASTAVTTIYPVGSVVMLTYSGGAWLTADYDANTKNTAGTSNKASTKMYLIGAASQTSSGTTTYTNSKVYIGEDNCLYSNGGKVALVSDLPETPLYAESIEWLNAHGDTSKTYVLPDGYTYEWKHTQIWQPGSTNLVPTSVASGGGSIYNGKGYKFGYRLNSSGVETAQSNCFVTGFIPVKNGDMLRIKPFAKGKAANLGYTGIYIGLYNASYAKLASTPGTSLKTLGTMDDTTGIFTINVTSMLDNSNIAFARVSTNIVDTAVEADGEKLIVTVNEEISEGHYVETYGWAIAGLSEDESGVPSYWRSELETKADTIQRAMEAAGRNKSAFLWYTDAHWQYSSKMSPLLLRYLAENTPMNKVNFGGDIIGDPSPYNHDNVKSVYEWRKMISDLPNHHSVYGNHDVNHRTTDVGNIAYALVLAPEESYDMVVGGDSYYYIDNPAEKTRYLYLSYLQDAAEKTAQGNFIVSAISGVPDGWHIVVIAHRWWQYNSASNPTDGFVMQYETEMLALFDTYNARGSYTASTFFGAQNFASAKGKVEFCIGGHIHIDYDFASAGGIPVIITAADANQERVSTETEDSGTIGTTTESAVFGIIADYGSGKITVVGVGRGTSREIDL